MISVQPAIIHQWTPNRRGIRSHESRGHGFTDLLIDLESFLQILHEIASEQPCDYVTRREGGGGISGRSRAKPQQRYHRVVIAKMVNLIVLH